MKRKEIEKIVSNYLGISVSYLGIFVNKNYQKERPIKHAFFKEGKEKGIIGITQANLSKIVHKKE